MKVTKVVTVQDIAPVALVVAKKTLTRLMADQGLPMAVEAAPGSRLPTLIKILPVRVVGTGKYITGLSFPSKYRPVEEGSGVFVGEPAKEVVPVKWRALWTPYGYKTRVTWIGQPAQPFAEPAMKHVASLFPAEFANDLSKKISRSGIVKTTRG